jgi:hypothetical protein
MRKYGRTDGNQSGIVSQLRQVGAKVQSLASVGNGCPDLLVGWQGRNILMEIKDGTKPPSERKLTVQEELWHKDWSERGQVAVVNNFDDALKLLNGRR